jgi:hypothetical protein
VFAQQIAVVEMSDDLIKKALRTYRAQLLVQHMGQWRPLSPDLVLQLAGFEKPELTVVLVDDRPDPPFITAMWGDICAAVVRDRHSRIIRLVGPFAESLPKAVCYVDVKLPILTTSTSK